MRLFKNFCIGLALILSGFGGQAVAQSVTPGATNELCDKAWIYEIIHHLHRWELGDSDVQQAIKQKNFPVWIKPENPKLDLNDKSRFAKIIFPRLGFEVSVKKADYSIPELSTTVKSDKFKIVTVQRIETPEAPPQGCLVALCETQDLMDYLFRNRSKFDYPDKALLERLRKAVREEIEKSDKLKQIRDSHSEQIVHIAPLSPVANEIWAYLENGNLFIRFSSDIEMTNPAVWNNETLTARVYDIGEQVVLSRDEAPGSNRFLTRAEAGRILFNCMVFGQRVVLRPELPPKTK
jgi:hypothetical protein